MNRAAQVRRPRAWALSVLSLALLIGASPGKKTPIPPPPGAPYEPGELLVKFKPEVNATQRGQLRRDFGGERHRRFRSGAEQWRLAPGTGIQHAMARLRNDPQVEYAEPNYIQHSLADPDDPGYPQLWGLNNTGQAGGVPGADISAEQAWDITTGSRSVVVAVIDSGIDYTHPDLAANIYSNAAEIPANGVDDDLNGFVDDVHGWDFRNDDNDPIDDLDHGTHVAGTIGAVGNNSQGVAGVSWQVSLLPLKFLGAEGSGTTADSIAAIDYATAAGVDIINSSWGGALFSQALLESITQASEAGILFVTAAGNDGSSNDTFPFYPADYDVAGILSVAATDRYDGLADFSNHGASSVDLGAPGVSVLSTLPGDRYELLDGTSMAAPHVAGAAALIRALAPGLDVELVKRHLLDSVDPIPSLAGQTVSGGRLNAFRAIATHEGVSPGASGDLTVTSATSYSLMLTWTATGDDAGLGTAESYDIRYSTSPFDESSFEAATQVAGELDPARAGAAEQFEVRGLTFSTTYYFAIKALDDWGNAGPMSALASGTTLGPPEITVTPNTVGVDLFTGGIATRVVTIENTGVGHLSFELSVQPAPDAQSGEPRAQVSSQTTEVQSLNKPAVSGPTYDDGSVLSVRSLPDGDLYDRSAPPLGLLATNNLGINPPTTDFSVLVLHSGASLGGVVEMVSILRGPDIPVVDFRDGRLSTPSLDELLSYDSVIVVANLPWADAVAIGNVLADYADTGGGVVLTLGSFLTTWRVEGRFLEQGYHPLLGTAGPIPGSSLGQFDAAHPIMAGVTRASADLLATATVAPGAEWVADWDFGQPFIATKERNVVVVNVLIATPGRWGGDVPLILRNAALWSRRSSTRLSVHPPAGVVPPGGSLDVVLAFDAARLAGGDYDADLVVETNDSDEPQTVVPTRMHVTGAADINLSHAALEFGALFVGASRALTLVVTNDSPDVLTARFDTDNPHFSVRPPSLDVPAGQRRDVTVTFHPAVATPLQGALLVHSNDPDEGDLSVALSGAGLQPPDIAVAPGSIELELITGQSASRALTVQNPGLGQLTFKISAVAAPQAEPLAGVTGYWSESTEDQAAAVRHTSSPEVCSSAGATIDPPASVLLLQDSPPWDTTSNEQLLRLNGLVYDVAQSPSLSTTDLSAYKVVIVANDQDTFYYNILAGRAAQVNAYVSAGGTLEFHAGFNSGHVSLVTLPGGMRTDSGTTRTNRVLDPAHPLMAGVPDPFGFFPSGCYFWNIPGNAAHIAADDRGRTTLVEYQFGGGRVIAGCQAFEVDYANDEDSGIILRNMIPYAHGQGPPWVTFTPLSGSVPPGGGADINVGLRAAVLDPGVYRAALVVSSNDPQTPQLEVPVSLRVLADTDRDGVADVTDNCTEIYNPTQENDDGDRLGDSCDNCASVSNEDQEDSDEDGSGDACQPILILDEIVQDGGDDLEVRARASDPQVDPLRGSLEVHGERDLVLQNAASTLDCALGFLPEGLPGQGIAFADGAVGEPLLFDIDRVLGCSDGNPDYAMAAGPCDAPAGAFGGELTLEGLSLPASICIRGLHEPASEFSLILYAYDEASATVGVLGDVLLRFEFTEGWPRASVLGGLRSGRSYELQVTVTDGSSHPVRAVEAFLYQGETRLVINNPPRALPTIPGPAECDRPAGATLTFDGTASEDADSSPGTSDDLVGFHWFLEPGTPTQRLLGTGPDIQATLPLGQHRIGLLVTDTMGESDMASFPATVRDTSLPSLAVSAAPSSLWPPNHRLVPVQIAWQAQDACDSSPAVALQLVTSSEPDDAAGNDDGHTAGDISGAELMTPDSRVLLRAERSEIGSGRVYSLRYEVLDAAGNRRLQTTQVRVPLNIMSGTPVVSPLAGAMRQALPGRPGRRP